MAASCAGVADVSAARSPHSLAHGAIPTRLRAITIEEGGGRAARGSCSRLAAPRARGKLVPRRARRLHLAL
eukprot:scaffold30881_cov28-Phaeocystis_antarctica.AAC.1